MLDSVRELVPSGDSGPNAYHCAECDRSFEVDAPPSRVICSSCGNEDVRRVGA